MFVRRSLFATAVLLSLVASTLFPVLAAVGAPAIAWQTGVKWVPFDDALLRAKAENKAVCVVVYADWCPKCRALAPRFAEQPILGASSGVIMVLQNSDERPAWLKQKFGALGNYVPRVFFLKPDGSVSSEVNSGNARFPYFYRASEAAKLAGSLRQAAQAAGPARPPAPQPAAAAQPVSIPATRAGDSQAAAAGEPASGTSLASGADAPLLALLAALAIGAVWFVSRRGESASESSGNDDNPT